MWWVDIPAEALIKVDENYHRVLKIHLFSSPGHAGGQLQVSHRKFANLSEVYNVYYTWPSQLGSEPKGTNVP